MATATRNAPSKRSQKGPIDYLELALENRGTIANIRDGG
jgi:hypothetical protein